MKRRLLKLSVLLLAGAIVNVAVAWTCAHYPHVIRNMTTETRKARNWASPMPTTTPKPTIYREVAFANERVRWLMAPDDIENGIAGVVYIQAVHEFGMPLPALGYVVQSTVNQRAGGGEVTQLRWSLTANIPRTYADYDRAWRNVPLKPALPGFAINTIFYAAILGVLFFAPGAVRRTIRRKRGLCPACAYDLRGSASQMCPECGNAVKADRTTPVAVCL